MLENHHRAIQIVLMASQLCLFYPLLVTLPVACEFGHASVFHHINNAPNFYTSVHYPNFYSCNGSDIGAIMIYSIQVNTSNEYLCSSKVNEIAPTNCSYNSMLYHFLDDDGLESQVEYGGNRTLRSWYVEVSYIFMHAAIVLNMVLTGMFMRIKKSPWQIRILDICVSVMLMAKYVAYDSLREDDQGVYITAGVKNISIEQMFLVSLFILIVLSMLSTTMCPISCCKIVCKGMSFISTLPLIILSLLIYYQSISQNSLNGAGGVDAKSSTALIIGKFVNFLMLLNPVVRYSRRRKSGRSRIRLRCLNCQVMRASIIPSEMTNCSASLEYAILMNLGRCGNS